MKHGRLCVRAGLCAAATGVLPTLIQAQQVPETSSVVVTAARLEQPLQDVVPDTTVLTRQDIEQAQTTDLVELLARQVGIEYAQSGGPGSQASIFMRGTNSNQVLVLVDGVPLNSALDGAPAFGRMTTDWIERIEIVRGNLSSLYGSSAVGGVIQIFTRAAAEPGARAYAEIGEGDTRAASGSVTTELAGTSLTASAGWREQNAVSAINAAQVRVNPAGFVLGANPGTDPTRNVDGSLTLSRRDDANELSAWTWGSHSDTSFDSIFDGPTASHAESASFDAWGASYRRLIGAWTHVALSYGQSQDHSVDSANVPASFTSGQFESHDRQATLQVDSRPIEPLQLLGGASRLDQRGGTNQYDPTFSNLAFTSFERRIDSFWLGTIGKAARQELQLNVRHDQYSDFGGTTTGLAGWGWTLAPQWRALAQWSSAFSAPSFNELYYPGFGNPNLKPERARTEELGLRWTESAVRAGLTLYRTRIDELIQAAAPTFIATNIGRASINGAELQAAATAGRWSIGGSLGLMNARDADTGLALLRRAHYVARATAAWGTSLWRVAGEVSRSGTRDDFDINTGLRTQLAPYTLARVTLERAIGKRVRLHLRVDNLLDSHYQLVNGYNTLPRLVIGGVEVRM